MKRSYISETNGPAKEPLDPSQIWNHSTVSTLSSLTAPVSPPRKKSTAKKDTASSLSLAAVEAGQVTVDNPVELFSARLAAVSRPQSSSGTDSRISYENWLDLYARNQHENGHHFVIHQHDHPIAGPHYDLRLQFSDSSSLSWAIMYGLPGDPNSRRINRNATETRVHCLWNHMMEMGSRNTGSMIIWDTGEYEVLPYHAVEERPETDDSASDISNVSAESSVNQQASDSQRLKEAFQNRKIRLRLHGTRLPKNYTISLRLSAADDSAARTRPITRKRRRRRIVSSGMKITRTPSTSRSPSPKNDRHEIPLTSMGHTIDNIKEDIDEVHSASASDSESIDSRTRLTNAYPGAINSIGSIHQRRWFITLDRANSGFVRDGKNATWKRSTPPLPNHEPLGFEPFYVQGPEIERSVVTGRTGPEVLEDENVEGFIPRRGWRPVLN